MAEMESGENLRKKDSGRPRKTEKRVDRKLVIATNETEYYTFDCKLQIRFRD